ncbi:MAG: hypothetical protein Q9176_003606 [Flavoplaca citrina]
MALLQTVHEAVSEECRQRSHTDSTGNTAFFTSSNPNKKLIEVDLCAKCGKTGHTSQTCFEGDPERKRKFLEERRKNNGGGGSKRRRNGGGGGGDNSRRGKDDKNKDKDKSKDKDKGDDKKDAPKLGFMSVGRPPSRPNLAFASMNLTPLLGRTGWTSPTTGS